MFVLVFTICAAVTIDCEEYIIDKHPTMKACIVEQDKRIIPGNDLFKNADNWFISCEKQTVTKGNK